MKVTISDVARLAGVSTATVSHTINNTRYVSSETKDRVYRAIAELGYTPDASARSFRTGKKKTVGFIVPDISNKFFATITSSPIPGRAKSERKMTCGSSPPAWWTVC